MTMINDVLDQLEYLKLKASYKYLKEAYMNDDISDIDLNSIYKILKKEVEYKDENNKLYNVKIAAFPFLRKIDEYDFNFQPSIKEDKIKSIIESNFYEEAINIAFIGNPGTGKTHLAIAIAYEVAIKRNSVYFIKFNKLINILKTSFNEGTLEKKLKQYFKHKLLVIVEVGFNEISELES